MGQRSIYFVNSFSAGFDFRRQNLTSKFDPRAEMVDVCLPILIYYFVFIYIFIFIYIKYIFLFSDGTNSDRREHKQNGKTPREV